MLFACWFELCDWRERLVETNWSRNKTDQIDMRIFNNHIDVFGSHDTSALVVSVTQVNANLGL